MRVHGSKFINGIGAVFYVEADGRVTAAWHAGHRSFAAHLDFDYRQPVPPGVEIRVSAGVERIEGRKAFTSGTLTLPDGSVAVEGSGIFVAVEGLREDAGLRFGET